MNVLITGARGFSGRALIRHLIGHTDVNLSGLTSSPDANPAEFPERVRWLHADLRDSRTLESALAAARPECLVHLAGISHGSLGDLIATNVIGTQNLLAAVQKASPACRVLVISSSAVYGYAGERPVREDAPLAPLGDYGISKAAQDLLALKFHAADGGTVAVARPFNLVGPGQNEHFVCGRIVQQIAEIETGRKTSIDLLETLSARDFIDVRDATAGYWSILSHAQFERDCAGKTFNLGSGRAVTVAEVIAGLEKITGRNYRVTLPEKGSPAILIPSQRSDNTRITSVTGWKPQIPLETSLADMLAAAQAGP